MSIQDNVQKETNALYTLGFSFVKLNILREVVSIFIICIMVIRTSHTQEDVAYLSSNSMPIG